MAPAAAKRHTLVLAILSLVAALGTPDKRPVSAQEMVGRVKVLDAGRLLEIPAHPFDLEGQTLRFRPVGERAYYFDGARGDFQAPTGSPVPPGSAVNLPFRFPFGGRNHDRLFVNMNGNVSFDRSETEVWPQRDPWADGTMRAVASALDARAASGIELIIAPLWAVYGGTVRAEARGDGFNVTWNVTRPVPVVSFYEPLGPNVFQLRLFPSGQIEFAYDRVSELDGIVGLFGGRPLLESELDSVHEPGDVADATVDVTTVKVLESGSVIKAVIEMATDVPASISSGFLAYRWHVDSGGGRCVVELGVTPTGQQPSTRSSDCRDAPSVAGGRVSGRTVELVLSRLWLRGSTEFSWGVDVAWFGREGIFDQVSLSPMRRVRTGPVFNPDFSVPGGPFEGNIFEVFHYPALNKRPDRVTSYIYTQELADDDIAVVFTDFRIDDLYHHGGSSGAVNVPITGIGPPPAQPNAGSPYGSSRLQVTMSPLFVGGPRFAESPRSAFRNHAFAVWWLAHEAVHRWAAHLRFRNPQTGNLESLTDEGCRCHWSEWLHAPSVYPVWRSFSDSQYLEHSPMGGAVFEEQSDGTFLRRRAPGNEAASGFSALDLYVMGLITPDEVPETFILRNPVSLGGDRYRATKVPVRIADILSAEGPRVPGSDAAQKSFKLGVYLLKEPAREVHPDMLQRALSISDQLARYFENASGRRSTISR